MGFRNSAEVLRGRFWISLHCYMGLDHEGGRGMGVSQLRRAWTGLDRIDWDGSFGYRILELDSRLEDAM